MQWVETTGRTIDEAKSAALDQLGVAEDDAEFEILEEPRPGLFGRVRGQARVRARVRPTQPRPKVDRRTGRRRGTRAETTEPAAEPASEPPGPASAPQARAAETAPVTMLDTGDEAPTDRTRRRRRSSKEHTMGEVEHERAGDRTAPSREQVAQEAERFMAGLVAAFGLAGTVRCATEGDELEVTVEGDDLGLLIGPRGSTLLAIQDVARVASQRRLGDHETRLRIDVAGYRQRRREALARFAQQVADDVVATGVTRVLEPMPSADRKVVHDALAGRAGIETRSEGEEPNRRVVVARRVEHPTD
jgi:spoIIIJ-associated protein